MKNISFLILLFFLSCSKSEFRNDFRKTIIDYEKTYSVKNPSKGCIYIYSVYFFKSNSDTLFEITRSGAGIPDFLGKDKYSFGVYADKELKNLTVTDSFKLSSKLILNYKRNFSNSLIWSNKVFPESITPLATYKLKNGIIIPVKTDTIWNH